MKYIRIPKERVGVLIGKDGETKKTIERISNVHLEIDSEEGDVAFNEQEAKDPLVPLKVEDIIRAIGRGFSPEHAFRLFGEETDIIAICSSVVIPIFSNFFRSEGTTPSKVRSSSIGQPVRTGNIHIGALKVSGTTLIDDNTIFYSFRDRRLRWYFFISRSRYRYTVGCSLPLRSISSAFFAMSMDSKSAITATV